jgi:exosortase
MTGLCIKSPRIQARMEKLPSTGILEEFRIEFLDCWRKLPNKAFFLVLLLAWLALFQFLGNSTVGHIHTPSLLGWMYRAYNPEGTADVGEDAHGNLIPFLVLGLFWWKRKELLALDLRSWSPGLLFMAFGLGLHLLGYVVQQPRISIIGLFTGIYGLMGLAWGPAWLRASFFPFFLFAFSVPLGSLGLPITFRLRLLVCKLTESVCGFLFALDIIRDGTRLLDPGRHYQYDVAAACSGIRSLVAILLMATAYAFVAFRSYWKRLLLVASAFPLAVLGNLLRMLLIILASQLGTMASAWGWVASEDAGQHWGEYVHSSQILSLIPYIPAIAGLLWLGHWLREPNTPAPTPLETKTI